MKPIYFDFTVKDIEAARSFFEKVLGWRFERFPMPYKYYRIQAGAPEEPGIDGGIGAIEDTKISDGKPLTQVTISVSNIDDLIAIVKENGGAVIEEKTAIPGIGWYVTCAEPGGLKFGMIQADPNAT